jgi:hypothetical protein
VKKIYSSQSLMMVTFVKDVLKSHRIRCMVKNELLAGGAGELPPIECWPELWIIDDHQYEWARGLVRTTLDAGDHDRQSWQCRYCGELLEGQFAQCWRCGQIRNNGV